MKPKYSDCGVTRARSAEPKPTEDEIKRDFVVKKLAPVIMAIDPRIEGVSYCISGDERTVELEYKYDEKSTKRRHEFGDEFIAGDIMRVDITRDSLSMIAFDVLSELS